MPGCKLIVLDHFSDPQTWVFFPAKDLGWSSMWYSNRQRCNTFLQKLYVYGTPVKGKPQPPKWHLITYKLQHLWHFLPNVAVTSVNLKRRCEGWVISNDGWYLISSSNLFTWNLWADSISEFDLGNNKKHMCCSSITWDNYRYEEVIISLTTNGAFTYIICISPQKTERQKLP